MNQHQFETMVQDAITDRELILTEKNDLEFKTHPKIAKAILDSSFVSSRVLCLQSVLAVKGRSHKLIRKRKNAEDDDKEEEKNQNFAKQRQEFESKIDKLKDQVNSLSQELESKEDALKEKDKFGDLLNELYQRGIIDKEGTLLENPEEKEMD